MYFILLFYFQSIDDGPKSTYASKWNIPIICVQWIHDSIASGCMYFLDFLLDPIAFENYHAAIKPVSTHVDKPIAQPVNSESNFFSGLVFSCIEIEEVKVCF